MPLNCYFQAFEHGFNEICEVFETDAFHAGLDEVFYIGHEQCPRCYGKDKAELFAGEVTKIRNHLKETNRELWIVTKEILRVKINRQPVLKN